MKYCPLLLKVLVNYRDNYKKYLCTEYRESLCMPEFGRKFKKKSILIIFFFFKVQFSLCFFVYYMNTEDHRAPTEKALLFCVAAAACRLRG